MHRTFLSLSLVLALTPCARAHPIPKDNHDRTIVVRLTSGGVDIEYVLEIDELTAVNDLPRSEWARLTDRREFYPVFLRYFAPVFADNLVATLDGRPIKLACAAQHYKVLDHLRCEYRFTAPWKLGPGRDYTFAVRECSYDMDTGSRLALSVKPDGLRVDSLVVPSAALQAKPADDRAPGDDERLRRASVTFTVESSGSPAIGKDNPAPNAGAARPPTTEGTPGEYLKEPPPGVAVASPLPRTEPTQPETEPPASGPPRTPSKLVHLLTDTSLGIGLTLLFAVGFGAAHALTPGHGKTLVAAYLVGERGTVWHAFLLGLTTTATHTGAVLILAIVLQLYFGDRIPPGTEKVIGLVGGWMVAGLGLWLLMRRLSGRADHVHFGAGHGHGHGHGEHDHNHGHGHGEPARRLGLGPLIWLGIAGGIVPCWDAILVLIAALKAGLVWLGPALILAFSFGLASVLIVIGVGVVYARRHVEARSHQAIWLQKVGRALPLFSAVAITALGLWMCYDSVHGSK